MNWSRVLRFVVAPMLIAGVAFELLRRLAPAWLFSAIWSSYMACCFAAVAAINVDVWRMKRRVYRETREMMRQIEKEMPETIKMATIAAFGAIENREMLERMKKGDPPRPPLVQ